MDKYIKTVTFIIRFSFTLAVIAGLYCAFCL